MFSFLANRWVVIAFVVALTGGFFLFVQPASADPAEKLESYAVGDYIVKTAIMLPRGPAGGADVAYERLKPIEAASFAARTLTITTEPTLGPNKACGGDSLVFPGTSRVGPGGWVDVQVTKNGQGILSTVWLETSASATGPWAYHTYRYTRDDGTVRLDIPQSALHVRLVGIVGNDGACRVATIITVPNSLPPAPVEPERAQPPARVEPPTTASVHVKIDGITRVKDLSGLATFKATVTLTQANGKDLREERVTAVDAGNARISDMTVTFLGIPVENILGDNMIRVVIALNGKDSTGQPLRQDQAFGITKTVSSNGAVTTKHLPATVATTGTGPTGESMTLRQTRAPRLVLGG